MLYFNDNINVETTCLLVIKKLKVHGIQTKITIKGKVYYYPKVEEVPKVKTNYQQQQKTFQYSVSEQHFHHNNIWYLHTAIITESN